MRGKLSGVSRQKDLLQSDDVFKHSNQIRRISKRKPIPWSIRVQTVFVDIQTKTTEELGCDWIRSPVLELGLTSELMYR